MGEGGSKRVEHRMTLYCITLYTLYDDDYNYRSLCLQGRSKVILNGKATYKVSAAVQNFVVNDIHDGCGQLLYNYNYRSLCLLCTLYL